VITNGEHVLARLMKAALRKAIVGFAVMLEKAADVVQGLLNFQRHAAIDDLHDDAD
jgi:hypothetical protein